MRPTDDLQRNYFSLEVVVVLVAKLIASAEKRISTSVSVICTSTPRSLNTCINLSIVSVLGDALSIDSIRLMVGREQFAKSANSV